MYTVKLKSAKVYKINTDCINDLKIKLIFFLTVLIFPVSQVFGQGCNIQATHSSPIVYNGINGITISGKRIMNPNGHGISLKNCSNITITNCIISNTLGVGIELENCTNITIINNSFEKNSAGVYALTSTGIRVINNKFSNPQGPGPRGQLVQFDKVNGAGNEISYNTGESIFGFSSPEDLINVFESNGTANSPILIKGNNLRGGGPSTSGGGIMAGDGGDASFITVEDNILVDPGQYGIAVSGGTNIKIQNNQVFGREQAFTNVGIYIWDQYGGPCNTITVENNQVNFIHGNCLTQPLMCHSPNPYWNAGNCGSVLESSNNWSANINTSILPQRLLCPDLIAHYKFNDNANEANGITPINGTQSGGVQYACGNGSSASFDGVNDLVSIPLSDILKPSSNKIMFSAWVMPTDFNHIMAIAHSQDGDGYNDGWRLIVIDGALYGRVVSDVYQNGNYNAADVAAPGLVSNQWNFVAFSYDGSVVKLYINGVLVDSTPLTGGIKYNLVPHTNNMRIGFSDGQNYYFKGRIDDVKFYRGVFTDAEMLSEYSSNSGNFNSNATRPNVSITVSPNLNVCNQSVTLTALPAGATSYSWTSSLGIVGNGQSLSVSDVSTYTVEVSNLGCTNSASVSTFARGGDCPIFGRKAADVADQTDADPDNEQPDEVTVYPNPTMSAVTLATPWIADADSPILIYNSNGVSVHTGIIRKGQWKAQIDTRNFQEGLYFVRVIQGTRSIHTVKFIVSY